MCELDILHDSLYQFCPELHLKRLNSLTLACHALLDCKTLTLTELGRNLPTKARTKHNIKRIDRFDGESVFIITEADRSSTTIMLGYEY